ncbi:MAG: hypothetical protein EOO73_28125 [Myxococcales bacterium]|nr:MAG: hypothetical protein EOO73_28125 [Myxococcales bacterium]
MREDDPNACPAIVDTLEQHRSALLGYLTGLENEQVVDYYKFRDPADLAEHGPCFHRDTLITQCQREGQLFAHEVMQEHELVHAYTAPRGRSARFLDEGLAEALSCGLESRTRSSATLAELVAWNDTNEEVLALQAAASILVAHLLRVRGPDAFLELHAALRFGASFEQVDEAFRQVYGSFSNDLYQEAQVASRSEVGCIRIWECAGKEWDTTQSGYQLQASCAQPSFTAFEVTEPSLFVGFTAQLLACDADGFSPSPKAPLSMPTIAALEAGRYTLGLYGSPLQDELPTTVPSALYRLADVVGPGSRCEDLKEIEGPIGGSVSFETATLASFAAERSVVLRLKDTSLAARRKFLATQGQMLGVAADCAEGLELQVCDDCSTLDTCASLCDPSGTVDGSVPLPEHPVLKLDWPDYESSEVLTFSLSTPTLP